jgi:membrane fusion protein, multidrug efflux system
MYRSRILALLFVLTQLLACSKTSVVKVENPPPPVVVAVAEKKTVPVQVRTIGSVKAVATVAVRPRVSGLLTGVFFKEGDDVKEDQRLFTIDPRPYDAAVKLAQANQAKNAVLLKGAQQDLARTEVLWKRGAETDAAMEAARTAVESARAAVQADEAAVHAAQIQAGFTTITSPLEGRVGELLVNRGNLVDANSSTPLVVVNQMSPIYVTFALPEQQLSAVSAAHREHPLKVEAYLRNNKAPIPGVLAFIDSAVNIGTGTVQLKAEFPNTDRKLWPGQFIDVVLTVGERKDSVVVTRSAVQMGQQGPFTFVIKDNNTAELRVVTVAFETGDDVVIATGLQGGERVVTDGHLRLTNGTKVEVKSTAPGGSGSSTTSGRSAG